MGPPEVVSTGRADLAAALIRPDGVVAWAAQSDSDCPELVRRTWGLT
ncbi:hypothetical protein [Fodinicola acaciae]